MLTELSGLILHILVYTGKCDNLGGKKCDGSLKMKFMDRKLDTGHRLWLDNFYNTYDLALHLLHANTYCVVTLHVDCNSYATQVLWKDKGDVVFFVTESEDVIQGTVRK
jgi:hypothetical protein